MNILIFVMFVKLVMSESSEGTSGTDFGKDVVKYINDKIDQLLLQNPEKEVTDLKLNAEFNEERMKLKLAKISTETITLEEEQNVQEAIRRFTKYVAKYQDISNQLKVAIRELDSLQYNDRLPVETKYNALLLKQDLEDCESVKEAAKILPKYQNFKQEISFNTGTNSTLTDEHKKYFEEILKLLQGHSLLDDPKMQNFLQELLNNPDQLKTLAEALKKLEEDYDYDEDICESFFDLFNLFLG